MAGRVGVWLLKNSLRVRTNWKKEKDTKERSVDSLLFMDHNSKSRPWRPLVALLKFKSNKIMQYMARAVESDKPELTWANIFHICRSGSATRGIAWAMGRKENRSSYVEGAARAVVFRWSLWRSEQTWSMEQYLHWTVFSVVKTGLKLRFVVVVGWVSVH